MKKFIIILISLILLSGLAYVLLFTNLFGKKRYSTINSFDEPIKIPLPGYTYKSNEEKDNPNYIIATFKTLKSVDSVEAFIDSYISDLTPCAEDYYQDDKINTTIFYYYVEDGFPFNNIVIVYGDNPTCNGTCPNYEDAECYNEYYNR